MTNKYRTESMAPLYIYCEIWHSAENSIMGLSALKLDVAYMNPLQTKHVRFRHMSTQYEPHKKHSPPQ